MESSLNDLKYFSNKISKENLILLEGKNLLKEALKADCIKLQRVFYSNDELLNDNSLIKEGIIYRRISEDLMNAISDVKTNQGILAFANFYPEKILKRESFRIILDRVADPGNMGTIIRTAASVGCEQILVTKGSVNPWSQKVMRSAMGGHFYIDIKQNIISKNIFKYITNDHKILVADSNLVHDAVDYTDLSKKLNPDDKICLVIGNEAHGVDVHFYELVNQKYKVIPINIPTNMESLNCSVAFAVLAFELRKIFNKK
ncbi:RNA methyltransferase [Brachionus plicatilis]|uniref:RNA methyltransferase n=1 Tax=Brachionus plicatilis TaxID=10195 RepID=A0A3M7SVC1_BRAPC|nr:RNA methyltransferase [Brachionus plicatilis]